MTCDINWQKYHPPVEAADIIARCKGVTVANSTAELTDMACGGAGSDRFEVKYEIPGKGWMSEATVSRVRNGVVANYPEAYMRRRDPDCMVIGDGLPTDKESFKKRFGTDFGPVREQTFEWLKKQELTL